MQRQKYSLGTLLVGGIRLMRTFVELRGGEGPLTTVIGWSEPAIFFVIPAAISSAHLELKPMLLCSVMTCLIGFLATLK